MGQAKPVDSLQLAWRENGILKAKVRRLEERLDHYERENVKLDTTLRRITQRMRALYRDIPELQTEAKPK